MGTASNGKTTTVESTRSHARLEHDQAMRLAAKKALKYPPVVFNGVQARAVARGLGRYVQRHNTIIRACAILPQHLHLILEEEPAAIRQTVTQLKIAIRKELVNEGIHPLQKFRTDSGGYPKCFARGCWLQCLEADDVWPAIQYVQDNPVKEGKREQQWSFVKVDGRRTPSAPLARRGYKTL